jgi:RHS repeat-associated protein
VLTVVSDRKIAVASAQDWLDEFTNNDALNQAAAWNTVAAPLNTKSIDTDRLKFTSSNVNVGLSKTFATPDAIGTNYQISFDLDKGSCTQIKIVVFTAPAQSTPVYSNIVSASGTYVIPFTSLSAIAWIEVKKTADNGVTQSFYLDNIKLNNLSNPSQQVAYFTPDIISSTDYYAFGSPLNGRSFNSNSYKYGFNGKEKVDEISGGGNSYDFGARQNDPRLGRWWSVDPEFKKYAYSSPYTAFGNNPNYYIDPGGETLRVAGDAVARATAQVALQKLTNDKVTVLDNGIVKIVKGNENPGKELVNGTYLIKSLVTNAKTVGLKLTTGANQTGIEDGKTTVEWNPNLEDGGLDEKGSTKRPAHIGLAHELTHGLINITGIGNQDDEDVLFSNPDAGGEESDAIDFEEYNVRVLENGIRNEQGVTPRLIPDKARIMDDTPIIENGSGIISPDKKTLDRPKSIELKLKDKPQK